LRVTRRGGMQALSAAFVVASVLGALGAHAQRSSAQGNATQGSAASTYQAVNSTGLPLFPYLSRAGMDQLTHTDTMGHWCSRFAGETSYPLEKVEAWYRTAMLRASETDLTNDDRYKPYAALAGIKLALGIDYVTVFRVASGAATSIELYRCSPNP
jgi:hypothetical protein